MPKYGVFHAVWYVLRLCRSSRGLVSRMKAEMGDHVTVVATGGLAQLISSATDCIDHVEPMLTLEGLRLIYERNK